MDPKSEILQAAKGAIWTDENLEQSLDWQGDSGSERAPDTSQTTKQVSRKEERKQILLEKGLDIDVLRALTESIEERLLSTNGFTTSSWKSAMTQMMRETEDRVKQWMTTNMATSVQKSVESSSSTMNALDDRLASLERKVDEIVSSTVNRDKVELDIVKEAAELIIERRREENASGETPSEVQRFSTRTRELEARVEHLASIQRTPAAKNAPGALTAEQRRKKIAKMF